MAKKWRCTVCGYIHEGPEAPEQCPMCKVGKDKFVEVEEQEGNLDFVTVHQIGDGKGASPELWEGLQNHFMGECTEVGMYLAMSRQADREGYPEIAEAYKRYAWEEAEHASKFAELIGFRGALQPLFQEIGGALSQRKAAFHRGKPLFRYSEGHSSCFSRTKNSSLAATQS